MSLKKILIFLFAGMTAFLSCLEPPFEPKEKVYYFNSFESPADTAGWTELSYQMFVNDPSPNGGRKSLRIGGGCIQPAASISFPATKEDGNYSLTLWGKIADPAQSGRVKLNLTDETLRTEENAVEVKDTSWTFYELKADFYCPAGRGLNLGIYIGGIVPAFMFVDCIKIEKVDSH